MPRTEGLQKVADENMAELDRQVGAQRQKVDDIASYWTSLVQQNIELRDIVDELRSNITDLQQENETLRSQLAEAQTRQPAPEPEPEEELDAAAAGEQGSNN